MFAGASDRGGEGGVAMSDTDTDALADFDGGVDIVGEAGVNALRSLPSLPALKLSTASMTGCFLSLELSANRNFSLVISASTFKSPSSSLKRCVSIRNCSRSSSPTLISSSNRTPFSTAT